MAYKRSFFCAIISCGLKDVSKKLGIIKKAETLSQFFGPTSTYENNPLRRVLILIQTWCQTTKPLLNFYK